MTKKILLIALSFQFLFLTNCLVRSGNGFGSVGLAKLPSVSSDSDPDSDELFYMDLDKSYYSRKSLEILYAISATDDPDSISGPEDDDSKCSIVYDPDDNESTETKICVLDVMEYDLLIDSQDNVLKIAYNLPEGMCNKKITSVPWHFNRQVGLGPTSIYECTPPEPAEGEDDAASEAPELPTLYCASTADFNDSLVRSGGRSAVGYSCGGSTNVHLGSCFEEKEQLCQHSYVKDGEQQYCCSGAYVLDGETFDWSENLKHCLGGPGRTSWEPESKYGFPVPLIQSVKDRGDRGTFDTKLVLSVTSDTSRSTQVANYLEFLNEEPRRLKRRSMSRLPSFLKAQTDTITNSDGVDVNIPSTPQPELFFSVDCVDEAGEVIHALKLMVREWNTHEEFIDFFDGNDNADPDVTGVEGEDCDYEDRTLFSDDTSGVCNDMLDFDDIDDSALSYPHANYDEI